jgi:NAD+ dependent glucose-6-phosphate dehydrogenase
LRKTVLITGAGGLVGSILREALAERYHLRLLSNIPIPDTDAIVADITDMDAMRSACQGVDSVIHLAAVVNHRAAWDEILPNNIVGTYNVYEAACQAGVSQVIFASSNHAVGMYDLENAPEIYRTGQPLLDHRVPVRADGYYGVSKAFGEELGRYYADLRSLRVICLRIGVVAHADYPRAGGGESLERLAAIWLSHRDLVQLVEKCLLADHVNFDLFYGISANPNRFYDLEHPRDIIGYVPEDRSDERLDLVRLGLWQPKER